MTVRRVETDGLFCIGPMGLADKIVAPVTMPSHLAMLVLGFYTIFKYWKNTDSKQRRNLRLLWLMLLSFMSTNVAVFSIVLSAGFPKGHPIFFKVFIVQCCDKVLSICTSISLSNHSNAGIPEPQTPCVYMCVCVYVYACVCVCVCVS